MRNNDSINIMNDTIQLYEFRKTKQVKSNLRSMSVYKILRYDHMKHPIIVHEYNRLSSEERKRVFHLDQDYGKIVEYFKDETVFECNELKIDEITVKNFLMKLIDKL